MGDTVLAGPVEFSPAEIAAIVAVLVGIFVVLTAPGWAALGYACVRRRRARGAGRVWPAALGGSLGGLVLSFGVCSAVVELLPGGRGVAIAVLLSWCACWAVSTLLTRDLPQRASAPRAEVPAPPDGWGG